jgi:hypothetical protein
MQHEIPLIRSVLDIIGDMPSATAAGATKGPEEE